MSEMIASSITVRQGLSCLGSCRIRAPVAQGIERPPPERKVARSNRAGRVSRKAPRPLARGPSPGPWPIARPEAPPPRPHAAAARRTRPCRSQTIRIGRPALLRTVSSAATKCQVRGRVRLLRRIARAKRVGQASRCLRAQSPRGTVPSSAGFPPPDDSRARPLTVDSRARPLTVDSRPRRIPVDSALADWPTPRRRAHPWRAAAHRDSGIQMPGLQSRAAIEVHIAGAGWPKGEAAF